MFLQRSLSRLIVRSVISSTSSPSSILLRNNYSSIVNNINGSTTKTNLNKINTIENKYSRFYSNRNEIIEEDGDEEVPPEPTNSVKKDKFIHETEKVVGLADKHEFQSETQKLLHIVTESLYTEKEVFVRELISNSSDAMEKVRHKQLMRQDIESPELPLEVQISTDDENKTLTIQDTGIGMSKEELIRNLGRIGYSGTSDFLKSLGDNPDKAALIGQFGVGFYSCFMAGHHIKVYSKSATPGSKGYLWESEGSGTYSISEAEGVTRGTKIIIHLKPNSYEYSKKATIESIVKKYSNFVGFPILLNGHSVNTIRPLWTLNKNAISEEEHKEFYQFLSKSYDTPSYKIHFSTDSPLQIRSLFYIPSQHMEKYGMGRMEPGVSLFSRKIVIQQKAKGLLPDWMRFVRGVVDSEDIPLNVSREHLQDNGLIQRISSVLVKRILKFLDEESRKDPTKYAQFIKEFGPFFKEGVITDFKYKEDIAKLLRFDTTHESQSTSLTEYVGRMKEKQNQIFYITAPTKQVALKSPYYEPFQMKGIEVLVINNTMDDFVLSNIGYFVDNKIVSVESKEADEYLQSIQEKKVETLSESEIAGFLKWITDSVGNKISHAKTTSRPISSPAIVVDHESASFRRMMKLMEPEKSHELPKQQIEFNTTHPIVLKLNQMRESNPHLATLVAEQIVDNAFIDAGLIEDSREMVPRLNQLLDSVLSK
eukprot:gene4764-5943_t